MGQFSVSASIRKATSDDDSGAVYMYGWAAMSTDDLGEPVIDSDNEYIPIRELEKAAQRAFLRRGGNGAVGTMHDEYNRADLIESFVLSAEKRRAFGLGEGPEGWMVGLRSTDQEVAKAVRSGAMLELSLRGRGRTEGVTFPRGQAKDFLKSDGGQDVTLGSQFAKVIRDLELQDVELLSIVDRGASANDRVRSRIVIVKRDGGDRMPKPKTDVQKRTAQVILADLFEQGKLTDLPPEEKEVLLAAMAAAPMTSPKPAEPEPAPKADDDQEPMPKAGDDQEPMPKANDGDGDDMPKNDKTDTETVELRKQNVELSARVVELEKAAKRSELTEFVKRDLAFFPGASVEDLVKTIEEARANMGKDDAEALVKMLKSASEVAKDSDLFQTVSVRKGGGSGSEDPNSELLEIAKAKRKEDPKLSRHESILAAGRERPDLWAKRRG